MKPGLGRTLLVFFVVLLSIGVNIGEQALARLHVDRNYLLLALVAMTVAGLLAHRRLLFIVLAHNIAKFGVRVVTHVDSGPFQMCIFDKSSKRRCLGLLII